MVVSFPSWYATASSCASTVLPPLHQLSRIIGLECVDHLRRQAAERGEWRGDYQDADLVFCKEDGSPGHPHIFSQAFERLVVLADLPRIRLHDVRHDREPRGMSSDRREDISPCRSGSSIRKRSLGAHAPRLGLAIASVGIIR